MRIALATPRVAGSMEEGLRKVKSLIAQARSANANIVCFPEAYLPGLRGLDFPVPAFDVTQQQMVVEKVGSWAREFAIAVILGLEWHTEAGRHIAAPVWNAQGDLLGVQTKNQLDPTEEPLYVPGNTRRIFEIEGLRFGVVICHEGFRYPETVRWAASRGAQIVFHPHCTGSDITGVRISDWGLPSSPYYEKAIMCRALENTIYFASVNYAFMYQESATSIISPCGRCLHFLSYGEEGVLVREIDLSLATGLLARRLALDRLVEA